MSADTGARERVARGLRAARDRRRGDERDYDFLRELAVDGLQALNALKAEPLTTGEGGDATAYAWECAENMKGWALRAEESNRELRAERDRLREQLDAAREALAATRLDAEKTYKWRERFEERAIRAEAELRKVSAELQAARAALGVVGEADDE